MVEALGAHEAMQNATISSKARDGTAYMVIDWEDLLLIRSKFRWSGPDSCYHGILLGSQTNNAASLLDSLHCILNLEQSPLR
jgi:hypothetical protein